MKRIDAAMNVVGQAFIFPHDLKQPRTHVLTKNRIEQPYGVAAIIVARACADSESNLRLSRVLALQPNAGGCLLISRRRERGDRSSSKPTFMALDQTDCSSVCHVACQGDDSVLGDVIGSMAGNRPGSSEAIYGLWRASEWPAERMVGPKRFADKIVHEMLRLVEVHRQLFLDNTSLFSDVVGLENRIGQHIEHYLDDMSEVIRVSARVDAGALLSSKSVKRATDAFHGLRYLMGRAPG